MINEEINQQAQSLQEKQWSGRWGLRYNPHSRTSICTALLRIYTQLNCMQTICTLRQSVKFYYSFLTFHYVFVNVPLLSFIFYLLWQNSLQPIGHAEKVQQRCLQGTYLEPPVWALTQTAGWPVRLNGTGHCSDLPSCPWTSNLHDSTINEKNLEAWVNGIAHTSLNWKVLPWSGKLFNPFLYFLLSVLTRMFT